MRTIPEGEFALFEAMKSNPGEALFALALVKPTQKRDAFLDAVCDGDAAFPENP